MAEYEARLKVSRSLLAEVVRGVDRELESRRALNAGLQQLIAFSGVLLAAAFALGARVGRADVGCAAKTLLIIFFVGAVLGLLSGLLIALFGLRPQGRTLPNPDVFRFYASDSVKDSEVRADLFEVEIDAMEDLAKGNQTRAEHHRLALKVLIAPLLCAAAGAITLFSVHMVDRKPSRPQKAPGKPKTTQGGAFRKKAGPTKPPVKMQGLREGKPK